ncbi:hypothetical protein ACFPFP_36260 [Bradyrhizobium sp. GCM10023182]|uniref:Uncharacterized protein n=1 Tax=Bradyrhizobium zhengyangense TaxID=2911009 RepID=A0ABS9M0D0_9BRAD|nr:hypothetical protein [Bradyrhizobium zhengyangense]MCG2672387.1 hypothetical protein [Bradyrhizobium zhengyangense]
MRFAIVLVSLLLFLTFVVSSARAGLSYNGYRELMPKPRVVGALAAIRVIHDPDLSRECLAQLKSFRIAALIAATTWIATGLFIVTLRAFDLQRLFD